MDVPNSYEQVFIMDIRLRKRKYVHYEITCNNWSGRYVLTYSFTTLPPPKEKEIRAALGSFQIISMF